MQFTAYLNYDGQCEAAVHYYVQHLGAKLEMLMRFGDTPEADRMTPEDRSRVAHACIALGQTRLMASDWMPFCSDGAPFSPMKNCAIALNPPNKAEAERIFNALSDQGRVTSPLQPTFFAAAFGTCVDRFGVEWMVVCEKP